MKPTTSIWDNFSNEGRVKKLLVNALNEADREESFALLRTVLNKLSQPPAFVNLWTPFLAAFLTRERVQFLDARDLATVEKMGWYVQQTPGLLDAPSALAIWQPVIETYSVRGEDQAVRNLALKLYQDPSTEKQTRAYCVRELARQGLIEDLYLNMYLAHLRESSDPQVEREIFRALNALFTVDFTVSDPRLENVNRIVQFLLTLNIPALPTLTPQIWTAQGIYVLLVKALPTEAYEYFDRAQQLNNTDRVAVLGLLACKIRLKEDDAFLSLTQNLSRNLLQDPEIAALLDLYKLLQWLDYPDTASSPLEVGIGISLAALPLHRYVGDTAETTLGRFYLVTGEAQLARDQFDLLRKNGLNQPEWGYYAAWAYALCGESTSLVNCFDQIIRWSGSWTVACVLLDMNPRLAERSGAMALLKKIAAATGPVASIVRSRLALAQTDEHGDGETWHEVTDSLAEALEALRTSLAGAIRQKDYTKATSLTRQPLFARLPLADQTFWLSLLERDKAKKLALLQQAADKWSYQRAALYLVISSLHQGNWSLANRYQEQALANRADPKALLIQTFITTRSAPSDEAIQQVEQLAALDEERAGYLLGHLYFYRAAARPDETQQIRLQAALVWQRCLASGRKRTPEDLSVLSACAAFIAYSQQRASNAQILVERFQELDPTLRQPWLEWHMALALLWYGTSESLIRAYPTLLNVAAMAGRTDSATATALLLALTRFAPSLQESTAIQPFLELLARFTQHEQEPARQPIISSAIIAAQRSLHLRADQQQRTLIEANLRRHLEHTPRDTLLLLWQVCLLLRTNKREEAAELLQKVDFDTSTSAYLAQSLLSLLKRTHTNTMTSAGSEALTDFSRDALSVARAIITGQVEEGYELLLHQHSDKVLMTWHVERILPQLCLYIRQKNITPPAFLTSALYHRQLLNLGSQALVRLAWCASFLGDIEQACRLWEEALRKNTDDERHPTWRQDFVSFLCRQAVIEHSAGKGLDAARKLRLAAHWTLAESGQQLSRSRLIEHAQTLEMHAVIRLMLIYLFPDFSEALTLPGRFHGFGLILIQNAQLNEALLSRDRERIQQEWHRTLQAQQNNMRFLHILGVIYREAALSKRRQCIDTEKDWQTSTSFWLLLLSSEAFWQYFLEERDTVGQNERRKLKPEQSEELWRDALDNILVYHSNIARKSFAAGERAQAGIHARCLALGRQSAEYLRAQLQNADLAFSAVINPHRLEQIKSQTQRLLDEWGQALLIEAEKRVDDANSIQQLPRGIRKNYMGGISTLEFFIRLDVPLIRVLQTCLAWYNDWCSDLNSSGTRVQYRETTEAARPICEKLQSLCNKENTYAAENREVALHLVHRGISLVDQHPERALHFYEEAKAWGSDNPNLGEMLDRARAEHTEQTALEYARKHQFEEAYQTIAQAEALLAHPEALRNLRMRICFRQARELEDQGRYTAAWSRGKQALALEPGNTVIADFIRKMENLLPEENHAQLIEDASKALEIGEFSQALQLLNEILPGSRLAQQAQSLKEQARSGKKHAQLIEDARKTLEAGEFSQTLQLLDRIPLDSPLVQQAQDLKEKTRSEKAHAQSIEAARKAVETWDFSRALQLLNEVPSDSLLAQQAQDLKEQVVLYQQPEALSKREEQLRNIIEKSVNGRARAKAREELSIVLTRLAALDLEEIKKMAETNLRHARVTYIRDILEEALKLDARNKLAEKYLAGVDKLSPKTSEKKQEKKGGKS